MSKVLIVEDQPEDAELTMRVLRSEGISAEFHVVDSLAEVERAATHEIDCVITDHRLVGFTSHDVLRVLTARPLHAGFIVLTGSISEEEVAQLLRSGARNVITKVHLEWLACAVRDAMISAQTRREHTHYQQWLSLFKRAIDTSPDAIFWLRQDRRLDYVNEAGCQLLGLSCEELRARDFHDLTVRQAHSCEEFWQRLSATGQTHTEVTLRRADGSTVIGDVAATLAEIDGNRFAFCILRDITAIRQGTDALRESETRWRALIENSSDAVLTADASARITYCSQGGERMLGYPIKEVIGRSIMEFVHPDDVSHTQRILKEVLQNPGKPVRTAVRIRHRDGSWRIIEGMIDNRLSDPAIQAIVDNFWDITELTHTTEQLRLIEAAISQSSEAIIITSADLTPAGPAIVYANRAVAELFLYPIEEVIGRTPSLFHGPTTEPNMIETIHQALTTRGNYHGEMVHYRKDGTHFLGELTITGIRDHAGNVKNYVALVRDVTDKRKEQARIAEAQRLESIGVLASGIAHDLNNVLTPITMSVDMLRAEGELDLELVETIASAAQRGSALLRQLLTFAKGAHGEPRPVKVDQVLHEIELIIGRTFPKNTALHICIQQDTPIVVVDPVHLHQVLLNLCVNAKDAMPNGGELSIEASRIEIDDAMAAMIPRARPGHFLQLRVTDSGSGIAAEVLHRIFEPFFTTKEVGKGTGLGLPTVLGIVETYGGFISIKSAPGAGSTFFVYFPAAADTDTAEPCAEPIVPRGRGETILVADDEPSILSVIGRALSAHGYQVISVADGAAGIAALARSHQQVSLVLTDVTMPIMDGVAFMRAAKTIDPKIPIIAMTGVDDASRDADLREIGAAIVLHKPFTFASLLTALATVLACERER